jgi:hypothetical protein
MTTSTDGIVRSFILRLSILVLLGEMFAGTLVELSLGFSSPQGRFMGFVVYFPLSS